MAPIIAQWMQRLWETRSLHLHNLLYHSQEELQLSNDLMQELLVIEERVMAAGSEGIPGASLPRHVADTIARLKKMQLLAMSCKEDRVFISFEPLFAKLVHCQVGDVDSMQQYIQIHDEIQEEMRRLDDIRSRQVIERNQLDEERKGLREREERLVVWEDELRQWQKSLMEKDQLLHQMQLQLTAEERRLQEQQQKINEETMDLENLRRELEEVRRHLEQQAAGKFASPIGAGQGNGLGAGQGAVTGQAMSRTAAATAVEDDRPIVQFLQQLRGQAINHDDVREIRKMQARYRWSDELLLAFLEMVAAHSQLHQKTVPAVADFRRQAELISAWGVDSVDKLEDFYRRKSYVDDKICEVWTTLGSRIKINDVFRDMYLKWSKTWGFSHEVILRACEETYKGAANPNLNYVDMILLRWRQAGVRTVEEGDREIERFKQMRTRGGGSGRAATASSPQRGPLAGVNVMPKSEEEAKAYERFNDI
ncbi:DnaD domain protein [Heliobacillus mobilis]|uniref:DnaD domain protein n=1 Tax=Heliobacterium mobile TaxID=28064 RepID=A0A6I3SPB9_HELMO|nr:DnaD domain protein [Heliobacterium mobile]MTV50566.1 DnaD domain protein [Heliobacterium mobile]